MPFGLPFGREQFVVPPAGRDYLLQLALFEALPLEALLTPRHTSSMYAPWGFFHFEAHGLMQTYGLRSTGWAHPATCGSPDVRTLRFTGRAGGFDVDCPRWWI